MENDMNIENIEKEEHVLLNNNIENLLKPESQENDIVPELVLYMELVDVLKQKVAVVEKYLADDDLKTEITVEQRKLVPLLRNLSITPYPSIIRWNNYRFAELQKMYPDKYTEEKIKIEIAKIKYELTKDILLDFLIEFLRYGVAVKREGRKEDGRAISAMLSETIELLNNQNKNNKKLF